jgi:hypothetical protein
VRVKGCVVSLSNRAPSGKLFHTKKWVQNHTRPRFMRHHKKVGMQGQAREIFGRSWPLVAIHRLSGRHFQLFQVGPMLSHLPRPPIVDSVPDLRTMDARVGMRSAEVETIDIDECFHGPQKAEATSKGGPAPWVETTGEVYSDNQQLVTLSDTVKRKMRLLLEEKPFNFSHKHYDQNAQIRTREAGGLSISPLAFTPNPMRFMTSR